MKERRVSAIEMARGAGVEPKRFRQALRKAKLPWHAHNDRWTVLHDSPQHEEMRRVLNDL